MAYDERFPDPGNVILDLAVTRKLLAYLIGFNHNTRGVQEVRRFNPDHPVNILLDQFNDQVPLHQQLFDATYIKVGSVVRNTIREVALDGVEYPETIVVNIDPMLVVSLDGEVKFPPMQRPENFIALRNATTEELLVVVNARM